MARTRRKKERPEGGGVEAVDVLKSQRASVADRDAILMAVARL